MEEAPRGGGWVRRGWDGLRSGLISRRRTEEDEKYDRVGVGRGEVTRTTTLGKIPGRPHNTRGQFETSYLLLD